MTVRFAPALAAILLSGSLLLDAQVKTFRPVTEAMLRKPAPGDWLNWRRTDNAWGYSPLDQITRQNVQHLQLAWSWSMDDTGSQQATPLVYEGVMYLPNPRGVIQALNAATGDLIWEYRPGETPPSPRPAAPSGGEQTDIPRLSQRPAAAGGDTGRGIQRNLAIFGDKIFGTTNDAHIVALDARTGKLAWDVTVADEKLGYGYTSGPIVVRGKVIAGMTGCSRYKEDVCFISGHDSETGKELWRTSTVARPGEPGGDTWGDLPLMFRAGSDAWIPGSYDAAANLVYWGTAQAKPWARAVRGTDGAALYTNSTLALDPDTGKMKWFYQHIPGETTDMDEVFESILIDVGGRQSLFKMGKLGILWQLDRKTGAFLRATDLGYQNIIDVDPHSGKVTYRQGKIPEIGVQLDFCPSTAGFKSWRAGVQSADECAVRADESQLRGGDVRAGIASGRRWRHGSRSTQEHETSASRWKPRRVPGPRDHVRESLVASSHAVAIEHRRTCDRGGSGVWRRLGSPHVRVRRSERKDPLADAAADIGARFPDHVPRKRQAVCRDACGHWRRKLVDAHRAGTCP
jgi:PQQ-dependent dehydrogenase (methanol/ethanol family)